MKALIAMSGGVDSSAAAVLMRDAGWDCLGVTMKLYQNEEIGLTRAHTCCSLDDVEDARAPAGAGENPLPPDRAVGHRRADRPRRAAGGI